MDYLGPKLLSVLAETRNAMTADEDPLAIGVLQFEELRHHIKLTRAEQGSSAFEQHVAINVHPLGVACAVNVVSFGDIHLGLGLWLFWLLRHVAFSKHTCDALCARPYGLTK